MAPPEPKIDTEDETNSRKFGRYDSFSSLKRYTSKSSLLSAYDFLKEKVVPDSMRKKPDETKLRIVVAFFLLVIIIVISLAQILYIQHKGEVCLRDWSVKKCNPSPGNIREHFLLTRKSKITYPVVYKCIQKKPHTYYISPM